MSLNFSLHSFPNSSLVFEVALHVISQQTRNRVLEVGKERTLEATESLLNTTFTEEQLSSLKAVCVDMWDPFISAIKKSVHQLKLFTINFTSSSILIKG